MRKALAGGPGVFDGIYAMSLCMQAVVSRQVRQILSQLRLNIDEEESGTLGFHFQTAGGQITLNLFHEDGSPVMSFGVPCPGVLSTQTMPQDLLGGLLFRHVPFGGWYANTDGTWLVLHLRYQALAAGVDAPAFKTIADKMVNEVAAVERVLRQRGLLL